MVFSTIWYYSYVYLRASLTEGFKASGPRNECGLTYLLRANCRFKTQRFVGNFRDGNWTMIIYVRFPEKSHWRNSVRLWTYTGSGSVLWGIGNIPQWTQIKTKARWGDKTVSWQCKLFRVSVTTEVKSHSSFLETPIFPGLGGGQGVICFV